MTTPRTAPADGPRADTPNGADANGTSDLREYRFEPKTAAQVRLGVAASMLEDETVVMDSLPNRFFRLNASGTFIWRQIAREATFEDIVALMQSEYALDPVKASETLSLFFADLIDAGLIVVSTPTEGTVVRQSLGKPPA